MSIGAVNSNNGLTTALQVAGLSADKIKVVEADFQEVSQDGGSSGAASIDGAGVRAALDQKIADDVASGALIPTCIDQNLRAHFRRPMVMMRHG